MLSSECCSFTKISSKKICDTGKYEELEKDTDSQYLALSVENLEDNFLLEKKNEWEAIRSRYCTVSFTANAPGNFFSRTCCTGHKKHDKRDSGLFKEELRCSEILCLCACVAKSFVATIERVTSTNSVAMDSIKELRKTVGMDQCQSIAKFLKRQSTSLQQIEDFERFSIVLLRMNKQRKDCLTFIQKE